MSLPAWVRWITASAGRPELANPTPADWDLWLRQARAAGSLPRLAEKLQAAGVWTEVPLEVARHLASAQVLARRQHQELFYECQVLQRLFERRALSVVLLKGAAYVVSNLDASLGRTVSDIDILVPQSRLGDVEKALMLEGWLSSNNDPYDQAYYRRWMHEIPPMQHYQRGTAIDVHHNILPLSGRVKVVAARLLESAAASANGLLVLSPQDMVLHSAAHLMHEGELEMGFRGLVDLDALVTEFGQREGFWEQLVDRAQQLDLCWPLFLALRYTARLLGTSMPEQAIARLAQAVGRRSAGWRLNVLDALYQRALRPHHASLDDAWSGVARWLLYVRSHLLRMPLHLLLPHLLRKAWLRTKELFQETQQHEQA